MPSPHPRIGLVADSPVEAALQVFREAGSGSLLPAATAARDAVLQGAILEAIEVEARSGGENGERAAEVLALLNDLLPSLGMPEQLLDHFSRKMERAIETSKQQDRQARLLALIRNPPPDAEMALLIAEDFDELDRLAP